MTLGKVLALAGLLLAVVALVYKAVFPLETAAIVLVALGVMFE